MSEADFENGDKPRDILYQSVRELLDLPEKIPVSTED